MGQCYTFKESSCTFVVLEFNEIHTHQIIRAQNWASFFFHTGTKEDYLLKLNLRVVEVGQDLNIMLVEPLEYTEWTMWFRNWLSWKATSLHGPMPKKPTPRGAYSMRTNQVEKSFQLKSGNHVLILDNTYSTLNDKTVEILIMERWNLGTPTKDLPVIDEKVIQVPPEVHEVLLKANECYLSGHYEQSSVMFRKAIDFAIRLRLLQSELKEGSLMDQQGNEITLSKKIALLRSHNLITQAASKNLDDPKWFGDLGAHSRTRFVLEDIRENLEPKVRAFLTGLALKV